MSSIENRHDPTRGHRIPLVSGISAAVGFLTVVPVPGRELRKEAAVGRGPESDGLAGTWAFPLVGLGVGGLLWAALSVPVPAPAAAALALAVWVGVTGGLHEDAWCDVADASFAVAPPERRRAILKDPRVGAHGLTATVLLLLLRYGALLSVPFVGVLSAPVIGRWAMVAAGGVLPADGSRGLGEAFSRSARPMAATLVAVLCLGAAFFLAVRLGSAAAGRPPLPLASWLPEATTAPSPTALALRVVGAWAAGAVVGWAAGLFVSRRLGGLNGDGYGTVGAAAELAALWAFLPWGV